MATTIKLKNGSGAPLAGDLVQGEPALDLTNKRLYTEDSGGSVIEVGTNPSTLTVTGDLAVDTDTLFVDASANAVGIGTASPTDRLDVRGTASSNSSAITIGSTSGVWGGLSYDQSGSDYPVSIYGGEVGIRTGSSSRASTTERVRIDSSGNVGVGTVSPQATLQVQKGGNGEYLRIGGDDQSDGNRGLRFTSSTGGSFVGAVHDINAPSSQGVIALSTNSNERMRIDASGNVGIGTDAPAEPLSVSGHSRIASGSTYAGRGSKPVLDVYDSSGSYSAATGYVFRAAGYSSGNDNQTIFSAATTSNGTSFTDHLVVKSSGRIGISELSPDYPLHISGTSASSGDQNILLNLQDTRFYPSGNPTIQFSGYRSGGVAINGQIEWTNTGSFAFKTGNDATPTEAMSINASGNLLVGTTSAFVSHRFLVQGTSTESTATFYRPNTSPSGGNVFFYSDVSGTQTLNCVVRNDGDLENTNNSYGAISDARLKSNIVDASSQIDDIMAVQVRSYTLNETGDTHIGVVAQELEASGMSGLVQEDEEGMKSVKYSILYMKAIKALQEAVTRIETLEAEVAALKGA